MKKFSIFALVAALFMGACSESFIEQHEQTTNTATLPDLTATFAEDEHTRTYVEDDKYLRWHEDDRLTAFFGNTLNRQYKFKGKTGDNSGTFSLVPSGELGTGNEIESIYAVYPYNEEITISEDGTIALTLPAVQSYAENSFGRGANTMIAVTENTEDTFLAFKNAGGYLKLKLYGDDVTLASIEIKGNNNEGIAGTATATIEFGEAPEVTMADDATISVTLDCNEGVTLSTTAETATEFWIVLPEITFDSGITITATDTEGGLFVKSTSNPVAISRNEIQPMAALAVEPQAQTIPNNEIWYTSATKIELKSGTYFGAAVQSNEWDETTGKGVITFEADVTMIGQYAFMNNSDITSITMPESVTSIGHYAFEGCSNLTSITIPDSVTEIENNPFQSCTGLKEFKGKYAIDGGQALAMGDKFVAFAPGSDETEYTIPHGISEIGMTAFYGCSNLVSVIIPEGVTTIGISAFNRCGFISVSIPNSVTSIDDMAFYKCESLQSVYSEAIIPPAIGNKAFDYNVSERKIYVYAECIDSYNAQWSAYSDYIVVAENTTMPDVTTTIYYTSTDQEIIDTPLLPVKSNTYSDGVGELIVYGNLTVIRTETFQNLERLKSITIPESVTEIEEASFYLCPNIEKYSGRYASEDGRSLIVDGQLISYAVANAATEYSIPEGVTIISSYAFSDCTALSSVNIANSVTRISQGAFMGCTSLESIAIPDSVTDIRDEAFSNCSSLMSVQIGRSVSAIPSFAFYNTQVHSVYIPKSVTSIGTNAFGMVSVTLESLTPPNIYSTYSFEACMGIYVPEAAVATYKSTWSFYESIIYGY